jgi:hypothetical protein
MTPLWFRLLRQYQKQRGYGPTLPFVFGAVYGERNSTGSEAGARAKFSTLLYNIRDHAPECFTLTISRCDRIRQPIIAPHELPYRPTGVPMRSEMQDRETLFVDPEFVQTVVSLEALDVRLWKDLKEAICSRRFSFMNVAYGPYTCDDNQLIAQSKQFEDDEEEL